jgi:hypothetical protein
VKSGLESNQSFDDKQYYYGLQSGFDIKAWNPDSALAQFNILDYPFALTRMIMGNDPRWMPRGSALPTFLVGIDQVIPQDADPRTLAGDDSAFPRFRFEAAYRTLVGHVGGQPAFFEVNFRHYHEIGASETVVSASLDRYTYVAAALLLPKGMYVSYSAGKLPLDAEDDRVFELGFHYGF